MHILIIEDDLDLGFALQQALKADNISSEWLRRVADAPVNFTSQSFDCILLDIALPDGTGMDLLARWRRAGVTLPIIMITARSALEDRLAGLDGGADDFIVKPFAMAELVSRIRAVQRRYAQQASDVWQFGDLLVTPRRHQATLAGIALDLSSARIQPVAGTGARTGQGGAKRRAGAAPGTVGRRCRFWRDRSAYLERG